MMLDSSSEASFQRHLNKRIDKEGVMYLQSELDVIECLTISAFDDKLREFAKKTTRSTT